MSSFRSLYLCQGSWEVKREHWMAGKLTSDNEESAIWLYRMISVSV